MKVYNRYEDARDENDLVAERRSVYLRTLDGTVLQVKDGPYDNAEIVVHSPSHGGRVAIFPVVGNVFEVMRVRPEKVPPPLCPSSTGPFRCQFSPGHECDHADDRQAPTVYWENT